MRDSLWEMGEWKSLAKIIQIMIKKQKQIDKSKILKYEENPFDSI